MLIPRAGDILLYNSFSNKYGNGHYFVLRVHEKTSDKYHFDARLIEEDRIVINLTIDYRYGVWSLAA